MLGLIVALTLAALACGEGTQSRPSAVSTNIDYIMRPSATPTTTATATATATASPTPVPPTPSPTPTTPPPAATVAGPPAPVATAAPAAPAAEAQSEGSIQPLSAGGGYNGQCGGSYSSSVTQWWGVVSQYNWDPCTALSVIATESGGLNVYNAQGSGACGVMQLLPCQYPDDGASNIAAGYAKYVAAGGWSPWTSFWG